MRALTNPYCFAYNNMSYANVISYVISYVYSIRIYIIRNNMRFFKINLKYQLNNLFHFSAEINQ